jgi:hypothetical protein
MSTSLTEGPFSFTEDQLLAIVERYSPYFPPGTTRFPREFDPHIINHGRGSDYTASAKLDSQAEKLCKSILGHDVAFEGAIERLDVAFSYLLETNFRFPEPSDVVARGACELLCRMPCTVPPLMIDDLASISEVFPPEAFVPSAPRTWENLKITRFVDSNTIRLALSIVGNAGETDWCPIYRLLANLCGSLLEVVLALPSYPAQQNSLGEISSKHEQHVYLQLARIFFWSAWNRCIMLTLWCILQYHLVFGYDYQRNHSLAFGHTSLLREIVNRSPMKIDSRAQQAEDIHNTGYMCRWAFQLLQFDLGSVSLDFRHFHKRYQQMFGNRKPRCKFNSEDLGTSQCSGESPFSCNRFQGMKIEDQSAHATTCKGDCTKLEWSEDSYRSIIGPRAVDISTTSNEFIKYRAATQKTMAISHVWSHGQGGRPEPIEKSASCSLFSLPTGTGFNECLHKRYCKMAAALDCNSYWMDTPCIPQDHKLRRESIRYINQIFADSFVTLICDRDLMSIDISPGASAAAISEITVVQADDIPLPVMESILAVLLVCDWNLRAWTFLEAMRGRRNLHLLCKNEKVVRLYDIICHVQSHGRIDISVLMVNAQHLLPAQRPKPGVELSWHQDRAKGLINVSEASLLLSHRHASREGDEVVIWSLLCSETACYTAMDFWEVIRNGPTPDIPTSYIMTNLPRIRKPLRYLERRLGWAPCRPNFPETWDVRTNKRYFIVPTSDLCTWGHISKDGFVATWLAMSFECSWFSRWLSISAEKDPVEQQLFSIVKTHLRSYKLGALIQPCDGFDQPIRYRGSVEGHLLAIIGYDNHERWHWKGVVDWPLTVPLPQFRRKKLTII